MKFSYFNPDQIQLIADNEHDIELLTRIFDNRQHASFRLSAWQFDIKPGMQPGLHPVTRVDMRLSFNPFVPGEADASNLQRTQGDGSDAESIRREKSVASILRTR